MSCYKDWKFMLNGIALGILSVIIVCGITSCRKDDDNRGKAPVSDDSFTYGSANTGDISIGNDEFIIVPNDAKVKKVEGLSPSSASKGYLRKNSDGSYTFVYTGDYTRSMLNEYVDIEYLDSDDNLKEYKLSLFADPLHFRKNWHMVNNGTVNNETAYTIKYGIDLNLHGLRHLRDAENRPITGKGQKVVVVDTAVDISHEDLKQNIFSVTQDRELNNVTIDEDYSSANARLFTHGTSISGIIGAARGNHTGGRGIAPDAGITSYLLPELVSGLAAFYGIESGSGSSDVYYVFNSILKNHNGDSGKFAVVNNSWNYLMPVPLTEINLMEALTGDGVSLVKSAGNEYSYNYVRYINGSGESSISNCADVRVNCITPFLWSLDYHPDTINVASVDIDGRISSYSTDGSSNTVSAIGASVNSSTAGKPAIFSTDVTGCAANLTNYEKKTVFNTCGNEDNYYLNYNDGMNGTSAAAAEVSGVIALMKQANSSLSPYQIKYLLITTARNNSSMDELSDEDISVTPLYIAGGSPRPGDTITAHRNWVTNGAGLKFSSRYGFGLVDGYNAVRKSYASDCDADESCRKRQQAPETSVLSGAVCSSEQGANGGYRYVCYISQRIDPKADTVEINTVGVGIDSEAWQFTTNHSIPPKPATKEEMKNYAVESEDYFCSAASVKFLSQYSDSRNYQHLLPMQIVLKSPHGTESIIKSYWSLWQGVRLDTNTVYPYTNAFYLEKVTGNRAGWTVEIDSFCPLSEKALENYLKLQIKYYR